MQRLVVAGVSVVLAMALGLGSANAADKKVLAFVVNGASDFWKIAEAGVKKAQGELPNYDLQFKYPEQAAAAVQQRVMDDLAARLRVDPLEIRRRNLMTSHCATGIPSTRTSPVVSASTSPTARRALTPISRARFASRKPFAPWEWPITGTPLRSSYPAIESSLQMGHCAATAEVST